MANTKISDESVWQMIKEAVGQLEPIEFEIEGLSGSYLPQLGKEWAIPHSESFYLGLSHYGIPRIKVESTDSHQRITCPVEFSSQENVNQAVCLLWQKESELFFSSGKVLKKTAWTQGNEYYEEINSIWKKPADSFTVSWEKFCEFSQAFTNGSGTEDFKPQYVYMDNSGGFKARGVWLNNLVVSSVDFDEVVFSWYSLTPVEGESIKHSFGSWDAYAPQDKAVFFFKSCNGNTLVGYVDKVEEEYEVDIYLSNANCNYAKFFES
jgi:hypothetical protein